MKDLATAIRMAATIHVGQTDKAGEHYILHCLAVMDMVKDRVPSHSRDEAMIVAVLHDSVEDHPGTPLERKLLESEIDGFFGAQVAAAIDALTHQPGESYDDYIERVAQNWLARIVKIADLTHNMDPRRIPASQIVDKDFARWDKYRKALVRLERE